MEALIVTTLVTRTIMIAGDRMIRSVKSEPCVTVDEPLTLPVAWLFTRVCAAGITHCRSTMDEDLKKIASCTFVMEISNCHLRTKKKKTKKTQSEWLYRVLLRSEGVLIHKREHFHSKTFVVHWIGEPRGAIYRQHCGQVPVVMVGTPGANETPC